MEEDRVVMPLPPVVVVDEEGVVHPPPVVVVEEEEVVVQPPPVVVEEEEEVVQPPPLVVEEEGVVQPPPVVVVEEEVVVQPPPVVVVEEEEVVQPPPVVVVEEEGVVQPPPVVVVEEEVVVQPPPVVVVEEEEVVQPPPVVVVEEEGVVVQPPPVVVVEEEVVVQPPPVVVVVEEEEVVQPPPLVGEEEVVVQPPPVAEEEAVQEVPDPDPHALLLAQWAAAETLGHAEYYRHVVAAGVDYVIPRCETARGTLLEVAEVLLLEQEPIEAAETLYTDLLEDVSRGMNSLLIGPAANIVDTLFNWPGPLAAVTDAARALVHDTFYYPKPEGGPLEEARRELGYIADVVHADAARLFSLYAAILGFNGLPGGQAAYYLWVADHVHAEVLAREALQMLNYAYERSLAADLAVRLCGIMPASRVRPGAGPLVPTAALRLQQTVGAVDDVLAVLHEMRDTLMEVEQDVLDVVTGVQDPPPP